MSLVIQDQQTSIASSNQREDAMLRLITYNLIPELQKISDQKVIDIYQRNLEMYKGEVDTSDIIQDVDEYNREIFLEIAKYDYETGNYNKEVYQGISPQDIIEDMADSEIELYAYDIYEHIDAYVEQVLTENNLGFAYPCYHDLYSGFQDKEVVILHDSQNFLLKEFYEDGFKRTERDCWDYMKTRVMPYAYSGSDE